jgi:soluble lytic murein transglycosylase
VTLVIIVAAAILTLYGYNFIFKVIYPLNYSAEVSKFSAKYNVDPYLVMGIIKAESNFNPNAISPKGAKGLMQITDDTGIWIAGNIKFKNFKPDDLYNPSVNIEFGCWYLKYLDDSFDGNTDYVILAYNGGIGNVKEWLKNDEYTDDKGKLIKIPFGETEEFLKRVKSNRAEYMKLYKEGIS